VVRLLLLIVAYWLILTYPWAFRIYTRVIEGFRFRFRFRSFFVAFFNSYLSRDRPDGIADAVEAQIRCSVATGQEWYRSLFMLPSVQLQIDTDRRVSVVSCRVYLFSGLDTRINIGSWYLMLIDLSCHGFVLFGCLCSTETIRFWVQIHKIMYTKPFRDAIAEVKVQLRPTHTTHTTHTTHDDTHDTHDTR
jgi:hypothetical protein